MDNAELKVLIIEDNKADFFIVREYLKRTRLRQVAIEQAESVDSAKELMVSRTFDVIFLDLSLNDTFGTATILAFRPLDLPAPVIVLTGLADEQIALEALKHGAQDYLVKGEYDHHLLEKSIRYAIERKKTQQLLRESEDKYKLLFESNPMPMWAYENTGEKIIMVNTAAVAHYGYSKAEFLGMVHSDLCPVAERKPEVKSESGLTRFTTRHTKKDTSIIDVEEVAYPLFIQETDTKLVVAYDITERKKAEIELRLWESIVINCNDAVVVTQANPENPNDIPILYVNAAFERMSGYTLAEVVGKCPHMLQGENTDMEVAAKLTASLQKFEPLEAELINYRKDGTEYWVSFSVVAVTDASGKPTHFVSIQRDVTEKKQLEQGIRKRLEALVAEKTRELQKALSKEKELVELKHRFVTTASHEFRTPLSTISFTTDFLHQNFAKLPPERITGKLQQIKKQVNHMTVLLEDVIMAGRTDARKIPVIKSVIKIREWVHKITHEVDQCTNSTHRIHFKYDVQTQEMETDEKLLRNIFINLMVNAIKFSPQNYEIWLSLEEKDGQLILKVRDQGIGISAMDKERLFEPFHRGSNTQGIPGTGLGLSIIKKAVDVLDGSIHIETSLGAGTCITVELPLATCLTEFS